MYDPKTARFLQEDTYTGEASDPLSLNLYTYCFNNPVMYTDPTGHVVAKIGTRGDTIQAIQEKLNKLGYSVGKADGVFGEKTKAAVIKFQKDNGLTVDGIVGNQTLTEIYFEQSKQSAKANGITLPEAQKAKVGQINGNVSIMTDAKFNQAMANIADTKAKTNGGSLDTDVKNNEIVVTKVNIGTTTPTSAPVTVTPKTAVPAASSSQMSSLTNNVAKISSAISASNAAAVNVSKSTSGINNGSTKNIFNTIVNTAIEFTMGAVVAADNNLMFGAAQGISGKPIQNSSVAFNAGKLTVDVGTAIKGISTIAGGLGGEIVGVGLDGTIVLAPAGAAVAVASAGAVAYGGAVTSRSIGNVVNDSRDLNNSATQGGSKPGSYAPDRELPRTKYGDPIPDTDAPHTQLGKRDDGNGPYNQARTWENNSNGKGATAKKDIDFSDHNSPDVHPNPHEHTLTPNNPNTAPKGGYKRGGPEPLK